MSFTGHDNFFAKNIGLEISTLSRSTRALKVTSSLGTIRAVVSHALPTGLVPRTK